MKLRLTAVVWLSLMLTGCWRSARLYNLANGETLVIQYTYPGLRGKLKSTLPSGEVLSGEFSTVARSSVGFGSIYNSVYGPSGVASGTGTMTTVGVGGQATGSLIATGDKGTVLQCEYLSNALGGHGFGACKDNHGTLYKMLF